MTCSTSYCLETAYGSMECIYIYICMYVCMYVYIHTYIHICTLQALRVDISKQMSPFVWGPWWFVTTEVLSFDDPSDSSPQKSFRLRTLVIRHHRSPFVWGSWWFVTTEVLSFENLDWSPQNCLFVWRPWWFITTEVLSFEDPDDSPPQVLSFEDPDV